MNNLKTNTMGINTGKISVPLSSGAPALAAKVASANEEKAAAAGDLAALNVMVGPTVNLPTSSGQSLGERVKAAISAGGVTPSQQQTIAATAASAAAAAVTEAQNASAVDAMDMEDITGKQHASRNLTQISVQQLDVYVEPHRVLTQLTNAHVPAKLNMTPVVAVFDTEGTPYINGTKLVDPDAPVGSDNTLPAFTLKHSAGSPCVGWLLVIKRSDVRFGRSYFSVNQDNVFVASYEVSDLAQEARFALLPAITDSVAIVDGAGAEIAVSGGVADVNVPIGGSARAMTAYVDYEGVDNVEKKAPSLTISGHNVIMYAYQLPYTREVNSLLAQAYVNGQMGELAQILLNAI